MDASIWSILASLGSFIGMIVTLVLVIRSFARSRAQELQELKDDLIRKIDEHYKDERERRREIYGEIGKRAKESEDTFVRREMCDILHGALKEGIDGMRKDIRRLNETDGD